MRSPARDAAGHAFPSVVVSVGALLPHTTSSQGQGGPSSPASSAIAAAGNTGGVVLSDALLRQHSAQRRRFGLNRHLATTTGATAHDPPTAEEGGRGAIGAPAALPLDLTLLASCGRVFRECVAPTCNDEGIGLDNVSCVVLKCTPLPGPRQL
jgi:hypothetical protein